MKWAETEALIGVTARSVSCLGVECLRQVRCQSTGCVGATHEREFHTRTLTHLKTARSETLLTEIRQKSDHHPDFWEVLQPIDVQDLEF